MTIININLCIETTEPPEMLNLAEDIEKQVVEALDLKQSPVLTYNIDVDIIEE
ncbi:hypothetical protein NVP1249A_01 [Vibrio phage 1.249.A._10N.261.55.B9]|uniref:Uncharacterized protein n=2 Tax=Autolykiviridae TaxID=2184034 RepID=A0A2I7RXF3_9VIRU|nr:hypothetical protein KMD63_gp01 [Vibrio phage 1.249.A._10N.261.55.B9]AUR98295.1 hypothetical protein NVP1249A_01 [Vibrio phage 1.249.A._10N.261.55.B9]AUR98317.1 hypothetical protein NVP1249B_01 [Vibrio phage 1.249.B._10N.261.55.B9]